MALRIEDYALIGNCESAGLVGLNGSIDWLGLPRFDSPAFFAALLGTEDNGYWRLAPQDETAKGILQDETPESSPMGQSGVLDVPPLTEVSANAGVRKLPFEEESEDEDEDVVKSTLQRRRGRAGTVVGGDSDDE